MMPSLRMALVVIFAEIVLGQPQKSISQNTGGACSPAVVSGGNVVITCAGLDLQQKEMLRRLPSLIDQLLKRRQADRDEVLSRLEEILKLQREAEARQAQRTITLEQHEAIVKGLSQYKMVCSVGSSINDREAGKFAQGIGTALRESGWNISFAMLPPLDFTGIQVITNPGEPAFGASKLLEILRQFGLRVELRSHPAVAANACEVHVGEK